MRKACRPIGRLFYLALGVVVLGISAKGQTPSTTTISDTVFAADGSVAQGTLLISWPAFTTSGGIAIAGGAKSVTLGSGGSLSVSLVPNLNATPTNTPYTVVYQLGNFVKTEYWLVPATSPTTLAVVRVPLGTGNNVAQAVTQSYVSSALANKADLVAGLVPQNQLASGSADSTVCLRGNATWGACGGDSNALSIQGVSVATSSPTDQQVLTYVASATKYQPTTLTHFGSAIQMDSTLTVNGQLQAGSFASAGSSPFTVQGNFGTLSTAASGKSLLGFGPSGMLQLSQNGGALVQVATLDTSGNLPDNANTATQLVAAPTQCSGSFSTGVQANGNANCSTADVLQLAETTAPSGIANYGVFWFDSGCHCPMIISNAGSPVQLSLANLFNSDPGGDPADTLEERDGTNPQALRVYHTYTDSSTWERTGLAWDQSDGYFVVKNENAGTGTSQRGLGFWIGSNIRWGIDTTSELKPFADNSYTVGTASLRPKTYYAGTSFDITSTGALTFEPCNDSTTGTSLNFLAKYNSASSPCAVKVGTGDTDGVIGIVSGGSGTSGNGVVTYRGYASCSFDGATTGGDYVVASTTNAGDCHDAGATRPIGVQVLGKAMSTNGASGTYSVFVNLEPPTLGSGSTLAKAQSCTNKVLGAVDPTANTANCVQVTPSVVASAQGNGSAFQLSTGTTTNGDFTSYDANGNAVDSGIKTASQVPWFTQPSATGSVAFLVTSNTAKLYGVIYSNATPLTTTQVVYNVQTADNTSNTYDIGLYNSAGSLVAHIGNTAGTTFAASTGWKTVSWTASATIKQGKYYLAITTNCTTSCAALIGSSTGVGFTFAGAVSESVTSGGTLPATITIPSDSYTATTIPTWAVQ